MRANIFRVGFLVLFLVPSAAAISFQDFIGYPFGEEHGDKLIASRDDAAILIEVPKSLPYFRSSYRYIRIDVNGFLSFHIDTTSCSLPVPYLLPLRGTDVSLALVAPLWGDVDIESGAGSVFLRTTSIDCKNKDILDVVERVVKSANLKSKMAAFFVPTWSLVVTWDHVGYYPNGTDKLNTFQAVLATDGTAAVVIFNYDIDEIQWERTDGGAVLAGINAGDGTHSFTIGSSFEQHDAIINKLSQGNTGVEGQWVFRVDDITHAQPGRKDICWLDCHNGKCINGSLCQCEDGYGGELCDLKVRKPIRKLRVIKVNRNSLGILVIWNLLPKFESLVRRFELNIYQTSSARLLRKIPILKRVRAYFIHNLPHKTGKYTFELVPLHNGDDIWRSKSLQINI